jgi:hypothetical protein
MGGSVGFVDGEGCFSVAFHKNPHVRRTRGWQVTAVFQVSQHERDRAILERLAATFGCGKVRSKGPNSSVDVFAVTSSKDLEDRVIPFFETHGLRGEAARLRTVRSDRPIAATEGASPAGRIRTYRSHRLRDERSG